PRSWPRRQKPNAPQDMATSVSRLASNSAALPFLPGRRVISRPGPNRILTTMKPLPRLQYNAATQFRKANFRRIRERVLIRKVRDSVLIRKMQTDPELCE